MKSIDKDFKNSYGKTILFLGKFHSATREELELFLDKFDIKYTDVLDADVKMFIEGSIMSPLEEMIADEAFANKIPNYKSTQFEKLYASYLDSDSILMSLKLSNNQDRLARLLQNEHIDNSLFLKLFRMYDWGEDGMFDNSENMEICTLFAKRFYQKKRFDPATFHSPISIFEIAIMSKSEDVLETLFSLPDLFVKQSRSRNRRPTNIKEALATNTFLNENTLKRLLRLNDEKVDYFLAQNPLIDENSAKILLEKGDEETIKSLSCNENLTDTIFEALLDKPYTHESFFYCQKIDLDRFKKVKKLHPNIGVNENLSDEVIELLIQKDDLQIQKMLSLNHTLKPHFLQKLYNLQNVELFSHLASNINLPPKTISLLYKRKTKLIDIALAKNKSTPKEILKELYNRDDFDINNSLALNESTELEHLQQLQLDTRLISNLKENSTFTKNILLNLGI